MQTMNFSINNDMQFLLFIIQIFAGLIKNTVQSFWYIVCCKFLNSEKKTDHHRPSIPSHSTNYRAPGTINLLDITAPQSIDIMLKPQ